MKQFTYLPVVCAIVAGVGSPLAIADTIVLSSGQALTGTALRTNGDNVFVMMDHAAFNFSRANIKEIKLDQRKLAEPRGTNRLPAFKFIVSLLAKQPWASELRPIPATVIDRGVLKNVPYVSFQCGEDYEVNIYGELDKPAGIEVGVYRNLLGDKAATDNCMKFASELMVRPADKELIRGLKMERDLKRLDGLTFEITPPTAEDAYLGWWVSAYSEPALSLARASDEEMNSISIPKIDAEQQARSGDPTCWSASDLKLARQVQPSTISFVTRSGSAVTNAQVVRVNDGASLVWRNDQGGGVVLLADLPEDLQARFGYDPAKAQAAQAAEEAGKIRERQEAQALAAQAPQQVEPLSSAPASSDYGFTSYSGGSPTTSRSYRSGGSVYVHGYYRNDGTYVNSYARSSPGRRR
jgi:hypothetical protein